MQSPEEISRTEGKIPTREETLETEKRVFWPRTVLQTEEKTTTLARDLKTKGRVSMTEGITKTEEKIPLYRALKAIANADQVDVDEIKDSVQEAVTEATRPLVAAVEHLPEDVGTSITEIIKPVAESLNGFRDEFIGISVLIREIYSQVVTPQEIDDDVDDGCIRDAFEFMRSLNQIDDLIADQKFIETRPKKDNSERLQSYRNTKLYSDCVAILDKRFEAGQMDEEMKNTLKEEFDALFNAIEDNYHVRAQRLLEAQIFRKQILDFFFFSGRCHHQQEVTSEQTAST